MHNVCAEGVIVYGDTLKIFITNNFNKFINLNHIFRPCFKIIFLFLW